MTQTDKLLARKEAGVGIVTFNNPERHNAVSLEMWEATTGALAKFAADDEVRVVVLTGAGGKAFVSGAESRNSPASAPRSKRPAPTTSRPLRPSTASTTFRSRPSP